MLNDSSIFFSVFCHYKCQCVSIGEWKPHESDVCSCAKACKLIFPLSAIIGTAERAFSLLNYAFLANKTLSGQLKYFTQA